MVSLARYLSATFLLLTAFCAFGHSEHDKARFVAPQGQDIGHCANVLRPCKTIRYAALKANKGDKVLVASGTYKIEHIEDLFYLQSNIVPIKGGFNRFDHYQNQSPNINVSTLVGIPPKYAAKLEHNGFNVITDTKSLNQNKVLSDKLLAYQHLSQAQQDIVCVDGLAGDYPCQNIDLLAHMPLSDFSLNASAGNDVWGHVDLNTGKEYAIIGLNRGTAVVDVTDPTAPVEVGAISGKSVTWRDIKVYQFFDRTLNLWQAYAYVTLDGSSANYTDNVTIIDLNNLPHSISEVEKNTSVYKAHNVYISNVDYSLNIANSSATPLLHLIGTNRKSGQYLNYDLSDPSKLTLITDNYSSSHSNGGRPYSHDGASMTITDERKNSDCVNAQSFCTVFIDFNETEMLLWDITERTQVSSLGKGTYSNAQYVHSGWSSEDNQYIFVHDELDERNLGINSTLRVFDISNLQQPTLAGTWTGAYNAIDHNGFVRGNRYYMSNYERGLTVLDITNPLSPVEVGYFDTFTAGNNSSFSGAWGVYPFLPSGHILISDINSGLYILKDNTKSSAKGQFSFSSADTTTAQGTILTLSVTRNGTDLEDSVSIDYQIIQGSAESESDYIAQSSNLIWPANDNSAKLITIEIKEDITGTELKEKFFVRLFNPTNGATLGQYSYTTIHIDGVTDSGAATFNTQATSIAENSGQYIAEVNRIGNTEGELSLSYELISEQATLGEDVQPLSGQLTWADGENDTKHITVTLIDDQQEENNEDITLVLTPIDNARIGTYGELTITIADDDQNTAPTVSINENFQANTGQFVTLTAQASDPEDDAMSYLWQQTAGTSVELSKADTLSATFTAPNSAENLTFSFTATDFKGAASTAEVTVTLVAPTATPSTTSKSSGGGGLAWLSLLLTLVFATRRKNP
ncbi:choice-of-anchor B family protein [Thalassotalea sp. G2M2-11]|uniref:choice-of-anchor B family protein n=1 Tax=Thalassotalea sp. G2M2-11 TaxID=2787627 RepID=UPI0019D2FDC4|nr:choice-of-anchor B family protein [Thalassotalea sp. G2M2-11]